MTDLTPERLDELDELDRTYDNENWRGWGITGVVKSLTASLRDERKRVDELRSLYARQQAEQVPPMFVHVSAYEQMKARAEQAEAERDACRSEMKAQARRIRDERLRADSNWEKCKRLAEDLADMTRQRDEARAKADPLQGVAVQRG